MSANSVLLFPGAVWTPLTNHSVPGTKAQRTMIVLHITAGPTAISAINTFAASKSPGRVSAHFVIDRDGTVYQLLPISDTAWHASAVNSRSVGIEHAAIPGTMPPTEEQYKASAALVKWLCEQLSIPCDREHIRSHYEASPQDGHVGCCAPTLDPDRIVSEAGAL